MPAPATDETTPSHPLFTIRAEIAQACRDAARDPASVQLLAVSKTRSIEEIASLAALGQLAFGENRVQELVQKAPALPESLEWHLIGHLQRNKARKVIPFLTALHSLDSLELAAQLDHIAADLATRLPCYLQVNVGEDPAKHGFSPNSIRPQFEQVLSLPNLHIVGLMTIPPLTEDPADAHPHFAALRELRDQLERDSGHPLPGLSMGMSSDFTHAIAEGATIIRIGTALFGHRPSP
jgi:PLP dependent protein